MEYNKDEFLKLAEYFMKEAEDEYCQFRVIFEKGHVYCHVLDRPCESFDCDIY